MVFTCHLIDVPKAPLVVTNFEDDALTIANKEGQRFRINRYFLSTPVLTCDLCGQPAKVKKERFTKKDYAECPDHARHMYEITFSDSNDVKRYSGKQRRDLNKQAWKWLKIWQKEFKKRMSKEQPVSQ